MPNQYYGSDQINNEEMDGASYTCGGEEKCMQDFGGEI
jgi:hypothetical protein